MDCVIKNHKEVYIHLNKDGKAVTCLEKDKTLMNESKAKNVLKSLPKTLKRLRFKIVYIPDQINPQKTEKCKKVEPIILEWKNEVPESVSRWIDKFGICDDIIQEAALRLKELNRELSNVDKQICNIAHIIESSSKVDMYTAWLERKNQYDLFRKRRAIKNEQTILRKIEQMDFRKLSRESVSGEISKLMNRKFQFRIVEEDDEDDLSEM